MLYKVFIDGFCLHVTEDLSSAEAFLYDMQYAGYEGCIGEYESEEEE